MAQSRVGTFLIDLPLEEAQRYVRGCVWKHLQDHGYEDEGPNCHWLSAYLCEKIFTEMFYADDELLEEPADVIGRNDEDWASLLGYKDSYIGKEIRRLVASTFLTEEFHPDGRGYRPQRFSLGPLFPDQVKDDDLFKQGDLALKLIQKKSKKKLKKTIAKTPKVTPLENRAEELANTFNNEMFETVKAIAFDNMALYEHIREWLKIVGSLKKIKLQAPWEEPLTELSNIIEAAEDSLEESRQLTSHSSFLRNIHQLLVSLYEIQNSLQDRQNLYMFAKEYKEYKEALCLQ